MRARLVGIVAFVALSCGSAFGGTLILSPERFGSTYSAAGASYGSGATFVQHGNSPAFLVHGGSNVHRGYMVFDLGSLAGKTILSVTFTLPRGTTGSTIAAEVWGKHTSGTPAFDVYNPLMAGFGLQVDPTTAAHQSIINPLHGELMGTIVSGTDSVTLDLAYFNSQVGSEVLLFARAVGDAVGTTQQYGHEQQGDGGTHLSIDYLDGPVIPLPHAGGMALAGLGLLAMRRRRVMA